MSEAYFALAGALIGVFGTLATESLRARRERTQVRTGTLRSACTDFTTEISRLRDLSHELREHPDLADLRRETMDAHVRARAAFHQLLLTSESVDTQRAGRMLLHCAYWQWQAALGGPNDYAAAQDLGDEWRSTLFVDARKELGLRRATSLFDESPGTAPMPPA
jgi:hypothetical protein